MIVTLGEALQKVIKELKKKKQQKTLDIGK